MRSAYVGAVASTCYGAFPNRNLRSLAVEATDRVLADTRLQARDIQKIYFANAAAGTVMQQEMVRGQVVYRDHALARLPLINIENACASGGSALHLACRAVAYGEIDVALVVGVEKLHHADKVRAFRALWGSTDVGEIGEFPAQPSANSVLMEYYAAVALRYLEDTDATVEDYAAVAVKNRRHARANPIAQFRRPQTLDEVLQARLIVPPLTLPMCAPLTDGATAIIVCSAAAARRHGMPLVAVRACEIAAQPEIGVSPVVPACEQAYGASSMGPQDMDLIELHDAAAPAEILQYAEIGLCGAGEGQRLIRDGDTSATGRIPVNMSGGLLSRGHALGATGCVQIAELFDQLSGRAGERQLDSPRRGMAVNGGGWMDDTYVLAVTTILEINR